MEENVRLDKYLWSIRAFKTRSEAADACNGNKVRINGITAKPSKPVKPGELIEVRKGPITLSYKVKALLHTRVGAALVSDYAENLTPESELSKMHAPVETIFMKRDKGSGRPTKKDRRTIEDLFEAMDE